MNSGLDNRRGRLRDCPPRPRRGSAPHRVPLAPSAQTGPPPRRGPPSFLRPPFAAPAPRRPAAPAATLPLPLLLPLPPLQLLPQNGARRSLPASSWSSQSKHTLCRCAVEALPAPSAERLRRPTNACRFAAAGSSTCSQRKKGHTDDGEDDTVGRNDQPSQTASHDSRPQHRMARHCLGLLHSSPQVKKECTLLILPSVSSQQHFWSRRQSSVQVS